jgi:hypothetical protein
MGPRQTQARTQKAPNDACRLGVRRRSLKSRRFQSDSRAYAYDFLASWSHCMLERNGAFSATDRRRHPVSLSPAKGKGVHSLASQPVQGQSVKSFHRIVSPAVKGSRRSTVSTPLFRLTSRSKLGSGTGRQILLGVWENAECQLCVSWELTRGIKLHLPHQPFRELATANVSSSAKRS